MLSLFAIAPSAQASTTTQTLAATQSKPTPENVDGTPRGPWWPEVNVYVGCNNTFSYSSSAWDLEADAYYSTSWTINYDGSGAWDINQQTLKASSTGFLTTSTFYGNTTNYHSFSATVYLYKNGQQVGNHTTSCTK